MSHPGFRCPLKIYFELAATPACRAFSIGTPLLAVSHTPDTSLSQTARNYDDNDGTD